MIDKKRLFMQMNKTTIDWLIRYEEIKASQEMNGELMVAKGEYAWVRVHAARKNIIELQVQSLHTGLHIKNVTGNTTENYLNKN